MGDNEGDTMSNILKVEWDFEDECFDEISDLAKSFIENLLKEEQEYVNFVYFSFIQIVFNCFECQH